MLNHLEQLPTPTVAGYRLALVSAADVLSMWSAGEMAQVAQMVRTGSKVAVCHFAQITCPIADRRVQPPR